MRYIAAAYLLSSTVIPLRLYPSETQPPIYGDAMDDRIIALDDARAVAALNAVVDLWTKSDGLGALRDIEQLRAAAQEQSIAIPDALIVSDLSKVTREQGELAREILSGLSESDDARVRDWASAAIGKY